MVHNYKTFFFFFLLNYIVTCWNAAHTHTIFQASQNVRAALNWTTEITPIQITYMTTAWLVFCRFCSVALNLVYVSFTRCRIIHFVPLRGFVVKVYILFITSLGKRNDDSDSGVICCFLSMLVWHWMTYVPPALWHSTFAQPALASHRTKAGNPMYRM